jgi:hypothetical protein
MDFEKNLFNARTSYDEGDEEFYPFEDSKAVWNQEKYQMFPNRASDVTSYHNQEDETDFESIQDESELSGYYPFNHQQYTDRVNNQPSLEDIKTTQSTFSYHNNNPFHLPGQSQTQERFLSQGMPHRLQPTPTQLNYKTQYTGGPQSQAFASHFSQNFRQPPPYYQQQQYQQQPHMPGKYRPMAQQFQQQQQQQQFRPPPMHNPMGGQQSIFHSQNPPKPSNYVYHQPVGVSSDTRDGVPLPKLPHPPIVKKDSLVYMVSEHGRTLPREVFRCSHLFLTLFQSSGPVQDRVPLLRGVALPARGGQCE